MTPKPKAARWLTEAFRDGVDETYAPHGVPIIAAAYPGAAAGCWLAHHDPARRPCSGPFERFHFIPRQRVENALGALLLGAEVEEYWNDWNGEEGGAGTNRFLMPQDWREELILLAAWDPRNGGLGCEGHHRHFDGHLVSLPREQIVVPRTALPLHVEEFITDFGLEAAAEQRFPAAHPHTKETEQREVLS